MEGLRISKGTVNNRDCVLMGSTRKDHPGRQQTTQISCPLIFLRSVSCYFYCPYSLLYDLFRNFFTSVWNSSGENPSGAPTSLTGLVAK